ncbi:MAG: phosphoribosylformylglycinamidine cyclo-ligase [Candidatus Omnitrophica bacterium]|nr:phosphoribosylformylglycinamidine cyclo-ligase [Candidatus Omnitrophota bacterium]
MKRFPLTYKQAGVDVAGAGRFVRAIQPLARLTRRHGLVRGIGGFGGLFELNASGGNPASRDIPRWKRRGRSPILVASADGVGTKLKLARLAGWVEPLGVDLVAMNVNDILCAGAEPLFFLDYVAAGRLNPELLLSVVKGIVRGCVEAHCVLLGGETAQMPLLYGAEEFDLAGFAVGAVDRADLITGERVRVGDKLLGLASNGLHANGFTLVQKVLSKRELAARAREMLRPTRIYVRPVLEILRRKIPVHGIAHITGGSFQEKIPRILPEGRSVLLRKGSWPVPPVFRPIQAAGVSEAEMFRTFNMGIGMVLILPPGAVPPAQHLLKRRSVPSWVIGEVTRGRREVVRL